MHLVSLLFFSLCTLFCSAQQTGRIIYEEKTDMHRHLPPEREDLKNMWPQFNTANWELIFTPEESIFRRIIDTELTGTSANQPYRMRSGRENRTVYKNLANDKMVDSREFMQKQFLIKGFASFRRWKIGKNQKEILGYHCMEASLCIDSVTFIKAWYAPKINISNGPADFQGLPGMILQIDINEGERTMTATAIDLTYTDMSSISVPNKGKEITAEEFEEIRKEKLKEMNAQHTGPGPMIITRRFN